MKTPAKIDKQSKVNAVNLPKEQWHLIRAVANSRSDRFGGRSSMSAVIAKLIDDHTSELKAEIQDT